MNGSVALNSLELRGPSTPTAPRYERLRVVGSGAFGVVHEALDRVTGKRVAMKELVRLDPTALQRFKLEFRAFVDLDHPNVVRVHALVAESGRWFVVMDFVDGVDLMTALRGDSAPLASPVTLVTCDEPLDPPPPTPPRAPSPPIVAPAIALRALEWPRLRRAFRDLASALVALHGAGRLHRDIKPSNVLVDRDDRVVLVDFGLSTTLDAASSQTGRRLQGTPAYMSPEQAAVAPLGAASDWYSFGVVLYQALTGALPFAWDDTSPPDVRALAAARDPRELVPGCPPDLAALALALLDPDPTRRPAGAEVLARFSERAPAAPTSLVAPFIGRRALIARLLDAFARARAGPLHVRIEGASGLGKSALIAQLDALVSGRALVLRGRAFEREAIPLKSVDALVDALAAYLATLSPDALGGLMPPHAAALARMFPVLIPLLIPSPHHAAEPTPQEQQRRAFEAFAELLSAIARTGPSPLVLVLDDAQWGDADGARLIATALTRRAPILLVTTCRSDHLDASFYTALAAAAPDLACESLELAPLSDDEAHGLATALIGSDPTAGQRLAAESRGHPYLLLELARRFARRQGDGDAAVISLDLVLSERVARLPSEVRALLAAIALARRPLSLAALATAVERAPGLVEDDLRVLFAERVVRRRYVADALERFECAHDRVREAASEASPPPERERLHARLATALERHEPDEHEAIARHHLAAGAPERASPHFTVAAWRALDALAFSHAAELFAHALDGAPAHVAAELLRAQASALELAGRDLAAARVLDRLLASPDVSDRVTLERRRAEHYLRAGHLDQGLAALRPVLAMVGERLPRSTAAAALTLVTEDLRLRLRGARTTIVPSHRVPHRLLVRIEVNWAACQGLANVDILRGLGFLVRHLRLALVAGERRSLGRGLGMAAMFLAGLGPKSLARAERYAGMASALAAEPDADVTSLVWAGVGRAMIAFSRFDWPRAHGEIERVLAQLLGEGAASAAASQGHGLAWELGVVQYFAALARQQTGDVEGVLADVPRWFADADRRGDLYTRTMLGATLLPWCDLCRDRPDRAIEQAREVISHWPGERFMLPHLNALGLEAEGHLYAGRAAEGHATLMRLLPALRRSRLLAIEVLALRMHEFIARAAVHAAKAGDRGALRVARKHLAPLLRRKTPWTDALAAGLLPACRGVDPALALDRAESGYRATGQPLFADLAALRRHDLSGAPEAAPLRGSLRARGVVDPDRFAALLYPLV